jgi:hypothetical protein
MVKIFRKYFLIWEINIYLSIYLIIYLSIQKKMPRKTSNQKAAKRAADEAAAAEAEMNKTDQEMDEDLDKLAFNLQLYKRVAFDGTTEFYIAGGYINQFHSAVAVSSHSKEYKWKLFEYGISKEFHLKNIKSSYDQTKTEIQRNRNQWYNQKTLDILCANEDEKYKQFVEESEKYFKSNIFVFKS